MPQLRDTAFPGGDWEDPRDPYSRTYGGQGGSFGIMPDGGTHASSGAAGSGSTWEGLNGEGGGGEMASPRHHHHHYGGDQSFTSTTSVGEGGGSLQGSPSRVQQHHHVPSVRMGARGVAFLAASTSESAPFGIGNSHAPQPRGFVQAFDIHQGSTVSGGGGGEYLPLVYPMATASESPSRSSSLTGTSHRDGGVFNGEALLLTEEHREPASTFQNRVESTTVYGGGGSHTAGFRYPRGDAEENASLRAAIADLQDRLRGAHEDLAAAHAREQAVAGGLQEFRDRQAALTSELRRAVAMEESLELATDRVATLEAEVEAAKAGERAAQGREKAACAETSEWVERANDAERRAEAAEAEAAAWESRTRALQAELNAASGEETLLISVRIPRS